jgi:hypothetical protein
MKTLSKALFVLVLLVGSSIGAMAGSITWTFSDVFFNNGNTVTGFFITDSAVTQYLGFSITVSGSDPNGAFTVTQMTAANLPGLIGAANSDFSKFIALILTPPGLTSAGGVVTMDTGFDCRPDSTCATLLVNSDFHPEVIGVPVSEPATLLVLGSSLGLLGTLLLRRVRRG